MNIKICLAIVVSASCCLIHAGEDPLLPNPATPAPMIKNVGKPLTGAEVKRFAKKVATAVQSGNSKATDKLIRMDTFADRLIADVELSDAQRRGFMKGANKVVSDELFTQQIVGNVEAGGSYDFLRIRMVDDSPRPLFRLLTPDGALNYHEYILVRREDGKLEVEDVYIYLSGETISQTIRRILIPVLAAQNFLGMADSNEMKFIKAIRTIGESVRSGDFETAIDAYQTLSEEKQNLKPMLIMYAIDVFLPSIISETNFPVAGPKLQPIIACPVAIVRFLMLADFPM